MQLNLNDIASDSDNVLNRKIEEREIIRVIKQLISAKAPGIDNIINEYIKTTTDTILFQIILDNSVFPNEWLIGVIKAIL